MMRGDFHETDALKKAGDIAIFTMDSAVINAIGPQMVQELIDGILQVINDFHWENQAIQGLLR
jgi:enoyl-CoA hydratase/carnithine racemase